MIYGTYNIKIVAVTWKMNNYIITNKKWTHILMFICHDYRDKLYAEYWKCLSQAVSYNKIN